LRIFLLFLRKFALTFYQIKLNLKLSKIQDVWSHAELSKFQQQKRRRINMDMPSTTIVDTLGWIASIITVVYTAFGLPVQIRKNVKGHSASGLSLFLFVFLFLTFTSWVIYGVVKPDWFIVVPNGLGSLCAFILVCQIIYYGSKQNKNEVEK